ncbi:Guanine nucleotide-binding protein alpha-2 subunit [Dimargaris xerosporica]|nr:Guanine nucleotide-binding protein alpha-2 subunit [Dimargaris xerosporica]
MGLCMSLDDSEESARSAAIDKMIEEDRSKLSRECKILLLGSGESGKSTIVKQMKIIHQNGYTLEELGLFRMTIFKNLIDSAQDLIVGMKRLRMAPDLELNREFASVLMEYRMGNAFTVKLPSELVQGIDSLWHDPIISKVMDRSNEFYLMDSAP